MAKLHLRSQSRLSEYILLDASILLAAARPVRLADGAIDTALYPDHEDVMAFLRRAVPAARAGDLYLVASDLAIEECAHHICSRGLAREALTAGESRPRAWHDLYKRDPGAIRAHVAVVGRFLLAIRALPVWILTPSDLAAVDLPLPELMVDYMRRYQLLAADAYHLAVAHVLGITMVASTDGDWLRAAGDFDVLSNK